MDLDFVSARNVAGESRRGTDEATAADPFNARGRVDERLVTSGLWLFGVAKLFERDDPLLSNLRNQLSGLFELDTGRITLGISRSADSQRGPSRDRGFRQHSPAADPIQRPRALPPPALDERTRLEPSRAVDPIRHRRGHANAVRRVV